MSRRLSDEAGFTVIELLTAMTVGIVVLAAALLLVGRASSLTTTTQDRVDAQQRGRAGLEAMVTELRSGVCAVPTAGDAQPPIIYGDGTRVEFYVNPGGANDLPQRRVLRYDDTTHSIWEDVFQGQRPTTDPTGMTGQVVLPIPDTARVGQARRLLENIYPRDAGVPVFTYWTYALKQVNPPPDAKYEPNGGTVQLDTPIDAADDQLKVSQVQVAIRVRPAGIANTANNPLDAILEGAAFSRAADPALAVAPGNVEALALDPTTFIGQPISCK
jgi:hypothetical protein